MLLSFRLTNGTGARISRLTATASALDSMRLTAPASVSIGSLKAGRSRIVHLRLTPGRNAKLGRYQVKVELRAGGRTVTSTVTVLVLA